MPWKEETIMSLKQDFVVQALAKEKTFTALCKDFNITRKTGYGLLDKFNKLGWEGLKVGSKVPFHSPNKTSEDIEEKIIETRLRFPTWAQEKYQHFC